MYVAILAGGVGSRLRPLTRLLPKPLIPLPNGQPLLARWLDQVEMLGPRAIYINSSYKTDMLKSFLEFRRNQASETSISIKVVNETVPSGTLGGLKKILGHDNTECRVGWLVMHADNYIDFSLQDFVVAAQDEVDIRGDAAMAVHCSIYPDSASVGELDLLSTGHVKNIIEKMPGRKNVLANNGIYYLGVEALKTVIGSPGECFIKDFLEPSLLRDQKFARSFICDQENMDVGTIERLLAIPGYGKTKLTCLQYFESETFQNLYQSVYEILHLLGEARGKQ